MTLLSKLAVATLMVSSLTVSSLGAAYAGTQDFTLHNRNGSVSVVALYLAHTGRSGEPWGENVLTRPVGPSASREIAFSNYRANDCMWDAKVVFSDGVVQQSDAVNLCRVSGLTAS